MILLESILILANVTPLENRRQKYFMYIFNGFQGLLGWQPRREETFFPNRKKFTFIIQ